MGMPEGEPYKPPWRGRLQTLKRSEQSVIGAECDGRV